MSLEALSFRVPDGRRISYAEHGARNGLPVLFCHGAPGSRWQISPAMAQDAAQQGVRIVAPERPGYGWSDDLPGRSLLDWARDAAALMDHLGAGRFGVLGYSMGGAYALACGHALPERVTGIELVSSIAPVMLQPEVMARMAPAVAGTIAAARDNPEALVQSLNPLRDSPDQFYSLFTSSLPSADQAVLSDPGVKEALLLDCEAALRQGAMSMVRDFTLAANDWGFPLKDTKAEVSIWHGTADVNAPPVLAQYLAEHLPNSRFNLLAGEGHLAFFSPRFIAERAATSTSKA